MKQIKDFIKSNKLIIGRDEWCQLPQLSIPVIKAKVDTGAKTSAIHAFNITTTVSHGEKYVCFDIHPVQANNDIIVHCKNRVIDERFIMSSNGHKEHRYIISTLIRIGLFTWPIELTLSNRDPLKYRMLLGREALSNQFLIDPHISCNQGKLKKEKVLQAYFSKEIDVWKHL